MCKSWLQEKQLSSSTNMMAAEIVVFCLFSSIFSTVASLKCQTCLVFGKECTEEDVKMVECKNEEKMCSSMITNNTLTNISISLMIKRCSKPEECYEGFYSSTTVDGRHELSNGHCCQTDGCNADSLHFGNHTDKYSYQGCTTKNACSYPIGMSELAGGLFHFNVTTLECRNASSHDPDLILVRKEEPSPYLLEDLSK
ncbi:phospholipase A2 inhibitor and Ly6/PLAUR domain-containing protein-like isoform X2 [Python bivittatus]|uniref:Phospholipase A2 inhibitor and Ly6/PLAUR domain-containing protein-like isoform X2 n=1 Tax=Python bivittatus TaxID=176946 RepID=A0A9F5IUT3_PYTBI|nr:phospholipase A2 inhibitor and Ly6/PLAUR domain-containing protein-like isoform X2 [Python bivittatus]